MFSSPNTFGSSGTSGGFGGVSFSATATTSASANPMKDFEVTNPPDDSIQCLAFSPEALPQDFLVAGSWDNNVRCWEVQQDGKTLGKAQQTMGGPVLDVAWQDDGAKVYMASADKTVHCWDLGSNQKMQVAAHDAPVRTVHWVKAPTYSCIMTGSWDKTLKFWDTRAPTPMMSLTLPERVYCADVDYPMAVVGTADRNISVYRLEQQPREFKQIESPLKYQHRCISIFRDKKNTPSGFALGSVEGRVAIQYLNSTNPRDNFTFKCHRSQGTSPSGYQEIYAVNDIKFHPKHGTLATCGSDGRFSFWDKDARTKLKNSEALEQSISCCAFNKDGQIFAYAVSYDWSKGHEAYNQQKKNYIYLRPCQEELKPRAR